MALCQQLVQATCDAGDEVLFGWRSFEAYPIITQLVGATPVTVPVSATHGLDLPAMAAAITSRTRLVFLCTPNNPTGAMADADEVEAFLEPSRYRAGRAGRGLSGVRHRSTLP